MILDDSLLNGRYRRCSIYHIVDKYISISQCERPKSAILSETKLYIQISLGRRIFMNMNVNMSNAVGANAEALELAIGSLGDQIGASAKHKYIACAGEGAHYAVRGGTDERLGDG